MNLTSSEIGLRKAEIDTPALLLDLRAMERNSAAMLRHLAGTGVALRPHVKVHKAIPALAQHQLASGAQGLTCAKLSEAERLAAAGFRDVLIANQIVGETKLRRLVNLAAVADPVVAVDDETQVVALARAAAARGVTLRVLVEIDIGHHRCGVAPLGPTLELARLVAAAPGLRFAGIMGYDGQNTLRVSAAERPERALAAYAQLVATRLHLERAGLAVPIVSASGTFTYRYASALAGITEIQAGSYLLMDTLFQQHGVTEFERTLTALTSVISRPARGDQRLAIIDMGRKSMDVGGGLPEVRHPAGAQVTGLSQEHGRVQLAEADQTRIGDKLELWVHDANGTLPLYTHVYALRDGVVEAVWAIEGRGDAT